MKFKVFIDGGIGLKEVDAEDILAVSPCVTVGEYLKGAGGRIGANLPNVIAPIYLMKMRQIT